MNWTMLKPDISLLCATLQNQSESEDIKRQFKFSQWILKMLSKYGKFSFKYDKANNLYITKGKADLYPCMVAHLDTVHEHVKDFVIARVGNHILAVDNKTGEQVGCGADDRVGVALAIEMFKRFDNIKLFFPTDEEIGCVGTLQADMTFFSDCSFLIQPDRGLYGSPDYINFTNGTYVTSLEFDQVVLPIMEKYGFSEHTGSYTDIGELLWRGAGCCAFNISCYKNAHSDQETVPIDLYTACLNAIYEVIETCQHQRWEHSPEKMSSVKPTGSVSIKDWEAGWGELYGELYEDIVMEEIIACKYNCNGYHSKEQIDSSYFCSKCQKTLGKNYLIQNAI